MIIEVKELCEVDYVSEDGLDTNEPTITIEPKLAIRTIEYDSDKGTLLEAFEEYENDFDLDKVIDCNDEFEGECQNTIKTLSVKELYCIRKKAINIIYDTDNEPIVWLPEEMHIPSYIRDDEIADYISDTTGYLIKSYILEYVEENEDE